MTCNSTAYVIHGDKLIAAVQLPVEEVQLHNLANAGKVQWLEEGKNITRGIAILGYHNEAQSLVVQAKA